MNSMDGVPDPDSGSRCPGAEDQGAVRLRAGDTHTEMEAHETFTWKGYDKKEV